MSVVSLETSNVVIFTKIFSVALFSNRQTFFYLWHRFNKFSHMSFPSLSCSFSYNHGVCSGCLALYGAFKKLAIIALFSDWQYWTPAFRLIGVLWFHHRQYVCILVGKRVFSETAHRIFLKLLLKLECLKAKNWCEKSHFRDNTQKHPQNSFFFGFCKK